MTYQSRPQISGFRKLSAEEVLAVSGGVVSFTDGTAQQRRAEAIGNNNDFDATFGDPSDTVSVPGGDYVPGTEDYNGDGSSDEIIVERQKITMVDDDYYGWLNPLNGQIEIYKDTANFFEELFGAEDQFLGLYMPGTPDNASLVLTEWGETRESSSGFNVTVLGSGGGVENGSTYSSNSGNTQYFQIVQPSR